MTRPLSPSDLAVYPVRCPCGTIHDAAAVTIRRHRRLGTIPLCPECVDPKRAAIGARARGATGRVEKAKRAICWVCAGLPHRRKRGYPCRCGGEFEEEPPVTIDDAMAQPRDASRIFPEGGA